MQQLLRWANKREVARELTRRGYKVSGETLNRWVREQQEVPPIVERLVLELYGITKEAPPAEADGAMRTVAEQAADAVVRRLVPPELLGAAHRLLADLARLEPPSGEAGDAERVEQDQAG